MVRNEILIETKRIGAILRVCAMDTATGTEVVFQVPVNASREAVQRLAASKMNYVLNKRTKNTDV